MRRTAAVWMLALAGVIVAGLGWQAMTGSQSAAATAPPVTLKVGWTVGPDNLSPFIGYETSSYEVWSLQYDSLFLLYPDGSFGPGLAAEIPTEENGGISAGGRVWTVELRPGVAWSDGRPLTAEDVAFTYNRVVGDRTSVLYSAVRGIERVEVVDPDTVRIRCSRPKTDMLAQTLPILPRHVWGRVSPAAAASSYQSRPPIVGSGPFVVTEFKKGVYVKLERNPHYWGERPVLDEVVFLTYSDGETMTQDLKLGVIDAALGLPPALFKTLRSDPRLRTVARNLLEFESIFFNCKDGPSKGNPALRDRAFRRAWPPPSTGTGWRAWRTAGWPSRAPRCCSRTPGPTRTGTGSLRRTPSPSASRGRATNSRRPGTGTPTATASARTAPASPSASASGHGRTRCPPRARAS